MIIAMKKQKPAHMNNKKNKKIHRKADIWKKNTFSRVN